MKRQACVFHGLDILYKEYKVPGTSTAIIKTDLTTLEGHLGNIQFNLKRLKLSKYIFFKNKIYFSYSNPLYITVPDFNSVWIIIRPQKSISCSFTIMNFLLSNIARRVRIIVTLVSTRGFFGWIRIRNRLSRQTLKIFFSWKIYKRVNYKVKKTEILKS